MAMVRSSIAGLALAFALLSHGSVAVPIVADQIVRREAQQIQVSLGPQGEFFEEATQETPAPTTEETLKVDAVDDTLAMSGFQICRFDFVVGMENTDSCKSGHEKMHEKLNESTQLEIGHIIGLSLCTAAATQTGAFFSQFSPPVGDEMNFPKGCFKAKCDLFSGAVGPAACFFYNGYGGDIDDTVDGFEGTPVCSRDKLLDGDADVQGCKAIDTDYTVIEDEQICRIAANCLGTHPAASEFRIGIHNASKHLDYVQGCLFTARDDAAADTRVYINHEVAALGVGVPGQVKGTNICTVSTPLQFGAAATPAPAPATGTGTGTGTGAGDGTAQR